MRPGAQRAAPFRTPIAAVCGVRGHPSAFPRFAADLTAAPECGSLLLFDMRARPGPVEPPGYFAFAGDVRPIPPGPASCRECGAELEPLRRYAGLCAPCIRRRARSRPEAARTPLDATFSVIREFVRETASGRRERFIEVRCTCGTLRTMKLSNWTTHRPACCNRCRLRAIDRRGFEAEVSR